MISTIKQEDFGDSRLDTPQRAFALEAELLDQKESPSVRKKYTTPDSPLIHKNVKFYVHKKRKDMNSEILEQNVNTGERTKLAVQCLQALGRLLQYFEEHSNQLIADGFFGVAMAKGQLQELQKDAPPPLLSLIKNLLDTCSRILSAAKPMMDSGLDEQITGIQTILQPEYWSGPSKWRGSLTAVHAAPWPRDATWDRPVLGGTPSEQMSDYCIGELLNDSTCNVSNSCWFQETAFEAIGYSLTHRLLYFQIARQHEGCSDAVAARSGEPLDHLVERTCGMILGEALDIVKHDFPERLRDLLLEQIAVCGIEGFSDFVRPDWLAQILKWQHSSGCYGMNRSKRSEQFMGGGCLVHYSAVATAALAVSTRHLLQAPIL